MPTAFDIISSTATYPVIVRAGAAAELLAAHPDAHVIIDAKLRAQTALLPSHQCLEIVANEDNKEYAAIADTIKQLRQARLTRASTLIAVGGGVIQDIAGFIASIYMRGVTWHYAPTTLLGMADSCIGGKSSINVAGTKNLVGTFYPPLSVVVDPDYIATLEPVQLVDGLCEAIKICFAHPDAQVFAACGDMMEKGFAAGSSAYEPLIILSLHAKKWFIETDEFDRKERLLLNFGHTFGHAMEAAGNYAISHGVAVGLGIQCAIAFRPDTLRQPRVQQLHTLINQLLRQLGELPAALRQLDMARVISAFQSDKKHGSTEYVIIVPDKDGKLTREKIARTAQHDALLAHAIEQEITKYGQI